MELKINIDYQQIIQLIHQLPDEEYNKLISALNDDIKLKNEKQAIKSILKNAPTWDKDDLENYEKAREHFNNSRIS